MSIKNIIAQGKEKYEVYNKISYSFYGKKFLGLKKKEKEEVLFTYIKYKQENNNISLDNYNVSSAYDDIQGYIKLKDKNGIMGKKINIDWEDDNKKLINNIIEGIILGKTYIIGGYTNTGKSMLVYYLLTKIKYGKCFFFSTEVNKGLVLKYLVQAKYGLNNKEAFDFIKKSKDNLSKMFPGLYIFDNIREIEQVENIIHNEKPDIVVIDFIQGMHAGTRDGYDKHAFLAQKIQQIGIENNATMISVAQVNASATRETLKTSNNIFTIKGAGEYVESSDVVFHLVRESKEFPNELILKVEKNKFGPLTKLYLNVDFTTVQFTQDNTLKINKEELKKDELSKTQDAIENLF